MIPVFHGEIHEGRISLFRKADFAERIHSLEGKRVELVLRAHKAKRSNNQNAYYWAAHVASFAKHCGYTPEEMHEAFKWMFLRRHEGQFPTVRSTSELNTREFTEYLEKIELLAAENGVFIPRPGEIEC